MKLVKKKKVIEELYLDEECQFKVEMRPSHTDRDVRVVSVNGPYLAHIAVFSESLPEDKRSDKHLLQQAVRLTRSGLLRLVSRQEGILEDLQSKVGSSEKHIEVLGRLLSTIPGPTEEEGEQ